MKIKLKRDKFRIVRGGYSLLLELNCRLCSLLVVKYQKDGPGSIYRLYFDRIVYPEKLVGLGKFNLKDVQSLKCPKCKEILGTPYIYKAEKRKCFRLYNGALVKNKL